jgi:hypothetical protein
MSHLSGAPQGRPSQSPTGRVQKQVTQINSQKTGKSPEEKGNPTVGYQRSRPNTGEILTDQR